MPIGASPWWKRLETLADRAQDSLDRDDIAAATQAVSEAFAIIDREGEPGHPALVNVLCVAADVSMSIGEVDSAAALYRRVADDAHALGAPFEILRAKALLGLANADVERGWFDRARDRYFEALTLLGRSHHPDAATGRVAVENALRNLDARASRA